MSSNLFIYKTIFHCIFTYTNINKIDFSLCIYVLPLVYLYPLKQLPNTCFLKQLFITHADVPYLFKR